MNNIYFLKSMALAIFLFTFLSVGISTTSPNFREIGTSRLINMDMFQFIDFQVYDTELSNQWTLETNISIGDIQFNDRTYAISELPSWAVGLDWIKGANSSKNYTGQTLLDFRVAEAATIYVAHQDGISNKPTWLSTWDDTGDNMTNSNGRVFSLFQKTFSAGSLVSLGNNGDTRSGLYTVLARVNDSSDSNIDDNTDGNIDDNTDGNIDDNTDSNSDDNIYQANGVKVGEVDNSSAIIWTRKTQNTQPDSDDYTPGAVGSIRIQYGQNSDFSNAVFTNWVSVNSNTDYTHKFQLTGLQSETTYHYAVYTADTNGDTHAPFIGHFKTAPDANACNNISFTMLTCTRYIDRELEEGFKIFNEMAALNPDFTIEAGDLEYYDQGVLARNIPDARRKWGRIGGLPNLVDYQRKTPIYFMKDDHDVLKDDAYPGQTYGSLTFEDGIALFNEQFPMGALPYRTRRWGKMVQLWFMEGRDYRNVNTDPDGPNKSIWGETQKQWFKNSVMESDADWKILVNPTPIVGPDKPRKQDNHVNDGWQHEGNEIRNWIQENVGDDMIILNGDRHWQYHSIHPETGIHEFSCGSATDVRSGGSPGFDEEYHQYHKEIGGFLEVDISADEGASILTLNFYDTDGTLNYTYSRQKSSSSCTDDEACANPQNVALGKTATQSSTYANINDRYGAANAIDGSNNGVHSSGSISHTANQENPWWEIDLGQSYDLSAVKIWNRTDCCADRLTNFHVLVSDVPFNSKILSTTINQSGVSDFHFTRTAGRETDINLNQNGRYLRIQLSGREALQLAEVEIMACPQLIENGQSFIPDPNKTYYLDVPAHNLRLAATGQNEDAYTTSTNTTGADVEWSFVDKGNGFWHLHRAAGGSTPRLRSDASVNADMQGTSSVGVYTYYRFDHGATSGTHYITLPDTPDDFERLQMTPDGAVLFTPTSSIGTSVSWNITEVSSTPIPTPTTPISISEFPVDLQFYGRDVQTNKAILPIQGTGSVGDIIRVVILRDGQAYNQEQIQLTNSNFSLSPQIDAALAEYTVQLFSINAFGGETLLQEARQIVAGDVYIITGQSNAQSKLFNGSAAENSSEFIRVYGLGSDNPTTLTNNLEWFIGDTDGDMDENGNVGQWGSHMAKQLIDNENIPICIFNGARAGWPVSRFYKDEANPENLDTNYGRLLLRLNQTKLADKVRGIFWYQGEKDANESLGTEDYIERFKRVYDAWTVDYPSVEHTYITQIRDGCGATQEQILAIQEAHRLLGIELPSTTTISAKGLAHDGCHFAYENGYKELGRRYFRLLSRDLYGRNMPAAGTPDIEEAYFSANNEITIKTRDGGNLTWQNGTEAYFQIEGSSVTVVSGQTEGTDIVLQLSGNGSNATGITYLDEESITNPYVINQEGNPLLSFFNFPISENTSVDPIDPNAQSFIPDPNKTYYLDVPAHNLRLAATGQSQDAYTTSTNTTGADVEWQFVDKGNDFWHIQRAAGSSLPRLRTDNSVNADMQATSSSGVYTYYRFDHGATSGTHYITLPDGPANFQRLQMTPDGAVLFTPTSSIGTSVSWNITEVLDNNSGPIDCNNPQNIAIGKTTTQSSTWGNNNNRFGAANAIDGNTNGIHFNNSITHTLDQQNAWWEIDLGEIYDLATIKIWNRTDCCADRLTDFHVLVSNVPFNSQVLSTTVNQNGVGDFHFPETAGRETDINLNQTGRYLRIQLSGTNALQLAEVEIMGCPQSAINTNTISRLQVDDCTPVNISASASGITVSNLEAAVADIQILDENDNQVARCAFNCGETESFDLPAGTYQVNIKKFTIAFAQICEKTELITIGANLTNEARRGLKNTPAVDGKTNSKLEQDDKIIMSMKIAPNPVRNQFSVNFNTIKGETYHLSIIDLLSKVHHQQDFVGEGGAMNLDMNSDAWEGGLYFLVLEGEEQAEVQQMVVVK